MLQKLTYLFIYLCLCINLPAQNPSYINYDTKDGLPSNEVYDIEIGASGLVWFSTDRGVSSFDGYNFKNYSTKDGLADNTNFEIYKDSKNRFWFLGFSGKLSIYEDGHFYPYAYNDSLNSLVTDHWVSNIVEDEAGDFYAAPYNCQDIYLFRFRKATPPEKLGATYIKKTKKFVDIPNIPLVEFGNSGFSFPKPGKVRSPLIIDKWHDHYIHFETHSIHKAQQDGTPIQSFDYPSIIGNLLVDDKYHLWVCTNEGLLYFENSDLSKSPVVYFKDYHITSILEDHEGNFWLSTHQNGVLFIPSFDIRTINIEAYTRNKETFLSIGHLDQYIYFGSANSRLVAFNPDNKRTTIVVANKKVHEIKRIEKSGSTLSIKGSAIRELGKKIIETKESHTGGPRFLLKNGEFLGFSRVGFSIADHKQKVKLHSKDFSVPFKKKITQVVQAKDETIWIGTVSGLDKIINYDYPNIQAITFEGVDTFGRVNDICIDPLNNKWIATVGGGLFYYTGDQLFQIQERDGLISNLVNTVFLSNDSTLWVGTNKGLNVLTYRFEKNMLSFSKIKSLSTSDGLSSGFINDIDYWKDQIWLATDKGVCYFDPNVLNRKAPIAPISIDDFVVNDSIISISDSLVLDHNENDIFINYTGINYRKESGRQFYRYRLISNGKTPPWFYSNEKNIRYNDLPPGKYKFEVSAQNKSEEWNEQAANVSFEIKPHFSQTMWFWVMVTFILLGIISLVFYFQYKRSLQKEAAKRQLQAAQLRAREAELAALRNQMNPHFVFNSLNSIQNFIFKKDTEKANYYLSKFSGLMRKSLQYTRLDYISIEQELTFLKDYLELEAMRFPGKFDFTINVEEELSPEYLLIPSLLLQPILENTIKHGFKNKQSGGLIEIEVFQKDSDNIDIYIRDNGPGLTTETQRTEMPNSKHKSLGMQIIKNRIALLNESQAAEKASVTFTNLNTIDPQKTGLQVHFTLPILYKT